MAMFVFEKKKNCFLTYLEMPKFLGTVQNH